MGIFDNTKLRFRVENLDVQYISLKRSCSDRGSVSCSVHSLVLSHWVEMVAGEGGGGGLYLNSVLFKRERKL